MAPFRKRPADELLAAVDLGSNSFHLVVARRRGADLHVIDRLRETVRLGAGLGAARELQAEARARALDCLHRFGQRLRGLPPSSVRAVGTNALRQARDARAFLKQAEAALGYRIEIVSGMEEARLVYLGAAQSLARDAERRLVVDIGGGSTELIIGEGLEPRRLESLYMGCVSLSESCFPGGRITAKRFARARLAARQELEPVAAAFRRAGWEEAVGTSGTVRSIAAVLQAEGWSADGVTRGGLQRLEDMLISFGHVDAVTLPGVSTDRLPVLPGGVAILAAVFDELGIPLLRAAAGALREGLLYDLVGRLSDEDVRECSVRALAERYRVDTEHATRVAAVADALFQDVAGEWRLGTEERRLLRWAALLHETGLAIAHAQYHRHGEYILTNADLPGFSRDEQRALAVLVRAHRRRFIQAELAAAEPGGRLCRLAILLRLATLVLRAREIEPPAWRLRLGAKSLLLQLPAVWLKAHPLTRADLEEERRRLKLAGIRLKIEETAGA